MKSFEMFNKNDEAGENAFLKNCIRDFMMQGMEKNRAKKECAKIARKLNKKKKKKR